jgi:hypothetical protein
MGHQEAQKQKAQQGKDDQPALADGMGRHRRNGPISVLGFSAERRKNAVHARDDRAVSVALLEQGRHLVTDDLSRLKVGELTFEAIPHFDPHVTVLGQDEDSDAVILALTSDTPGLESLRGPGVNRIAADRSADPNDDLMPRGALI